MDEKSSNQMLANLKSDAAASARYNDRKHLSRRITQNFVLIWMDSSISQSNEDCQNMLIELHSVVNDVNIFTDQDECVDFLTDIEHQKAFMIITDTIGQQIVSLIHDVPQLNTIYCFCDDQSTKEQWIEKWSKIQGVHTKTTSICEALKQAVRKCDEDLIPISFIMLDDDIQNQDLNRLEPSFMYTGIFKEILLEMNFDQQAVKDFATYCRDGNYGALNNIAQFENDYRSDLAIKWYSSSSFIYSTLNRALRMLQGDTIIKLGFFIHDLHHRIEQLYQQQIGNYHGKSFTVYRGQGLLMSDFEKLVKTKGGLISFNNFLSTSKNKDVSSIFAEGALTETGNIGILFKMDIDPSVSSTSFALIDEISAYREEEEVLFSMHTVFRISEIKKMDNNNNRLYQVDLKLTSDDDQKLRILTKLIRKETGNTTGWGRLGILLLKIGQLDMVEELVQALLDQTSDEREKARYYNHLGYLKHSQGDYEKSLSFHTKALEINQKDIPSNHPWLAVSYNNIGIVYADMEEHSKALFFYEKACEIFEERLPPNHPDLATLYENIGLVYKNMREYTKTISFYEKSREIFEKNLPPNHPDLASSYNNIGSVYMNMGEHSKALSFYEKAREIFEKSLPSNHPLFATSYNNIGGVLEEMGEYSKALFFYERALEIDQSILSPNDPSLATPYNNIGTLYVNIGEHSKALLFFEKSHEILEKRLPSNHSHLSASYRNIGLAHEKMGEYSKALSSYEKALEIDQKLLPTSYCNLAISYNNIASVHDKTRDYSKALSFIEKAVEIFEKTLPPNHPSLATSYNNIGAIYQNMGKPSKALSFFEKSLDISQKTLSSNHPSLAVSYNNIGALYESIGAYSKALSLYERALSIFQLLLPSNHPYIKTIQERIEMVKKEPIDECNFM